MRLLYAVEQDWAGADRRMRHSPRQRGDEHVRVWERSTSAGFEAIPTLREKKALGLEFIGTGDMKRDPWLLAEYLKQVHLEAFAPQRGRGEPAICKSSCFMNSSCFKSFVVWNRHG